MVDDGPLTPAEAAHMLGISLTTVRRLIANGEMGRAETPLTASGQPSRHRAYFISAAEVTAYVERARLRRGDLRHLWPADQAR